MLAGQLAGNPGRRPDVIVQPVPGVVYTTIGAKLCDHAGFHEEDIHVPLVVVDPRKPPGIVTCFVSLRQVAPTILHALKLKPRDLDAVRLEKTRKLPEADGDECELDSGDDDSASEG
jgi:arylsulfatase A-like enzyme